MNNVALSLTNINKKYILHHQKPTLVEGLFRTKKNETIWALKDINIEIVKGERIGIIGDNGSGKTTLLKIITGITSPTSGEIITNGRIASLISIDAGFHPELTGEENIYINGMLMGMSKREIKNKFSRIIDFSGIKEFIDVPFYTYSSGMKLRLGFSVAINSGPDILIIDEVISAGDIEFQQKSYQAIIDLIDQGKTVLFVSHYMEDVANLCKRVILLNEGVVSLDGTCQKVLQKYNNLTK